MRRVSGLRSAMCFLRNAAIAAGVAWIVMAHGAQVYRIQGSSMAPTLRSGERVLVNKIGARLASLTRDDIVLFRDPTNQDTVMVKRVIGVPGDTVRFLGNTVQVLPGSDPSRSFLDVVTPIASAAGIADPVPIEGAGAVSIALQADEHFVLGDNRGGSSDSRHWGAVARDAIIGQAVLRVYPWSRIGWVAP